MLNFWLRDGRKRRNMAPLFDPKGGIRAHPTDGLNNFSMTHVKVLIPNRFMMRDPITETPNGIDTSMNMLAS